MSTSSTARVPPPERALLPLAARSFGAAIAILALIALLVWLAALQLPDGKLHVAFLDVGQGDAILVTTPQGMQVLVDGGPSPTQLSWALGRQMPFWDRSLDLIVLTHPDDDHMTGLVAIFDRYHVDRALVGWQAVHAEETLRWQQAAESEGVGITLAERGMRIDLDSGVRLQVLHPSKQLLANSASANNDSVVLRLIYGEAAFLLTGDLEASGERALLASGQPLAAPVLKVSHHGSSGATTPEFVLAVRPQLAIIQVGANNRFGHPDPEVVRRLTDAGAQVLRTDQLGTIEIASDGQHLDVRAARRLF